MIEHRQFEHMTLVINVFKASSFLTVKLPHAVIGMRGM